MTTKITKTCFLIGPIGDEGSEERRTADWLLKGVVKPVLENEPFKYRVQRADEFSDPGMITEQALTAAMEADLVIADLTGRNPNAFYELAVRHMVGKPTIHMIKKGEVIPFDIKDYRAIQYSIHHYSDLENAKSELAGQVEATEKHDHEISNPITKAKGYRSLSVSSDSKDQLIADLIAGVSRLDARIGQLEHTTLRSTPLPAHLVPPVGPWYTPLGNAIAGKFGTVLTGYPPDVQVAEASSEVAGEADDEKDQSGSAKPAQATSSSREESDDDSGSTES